jgi:hypothetical protein
MMPTHSPHFAHSSSRMSDADPKEGVAHPGGGEAFGTMRRRIGDD